MQVKIENSWREKLSSEFNKPYFEELTTFIKNECATKTIYPPENLIFSAFDLCPFEKIKVVIIGQDPYHGIGQANGLCFSVSDGIKSPPSLQNIFKEIQTDIGTTPPQTGNLQRWAKQGIMMLNAVLTVESGKPGSHQNKGWETFTDAVIKTISKEKEKIVFILWGNFAINKKNLIDSQKHLILTAAHPSPFSCYKGFFGCKHFSKTNNYLIYNILSPIIW